MRLVSLLVVASVLAGCASTSGEIAGNYVPASQYANLDCAQINSEQLRVANRVRDVSGQQDKKAKTDQIAMGVGVIVFWPALFFLMSGDHKQELAQLKGEYDALNSVSTAKRCAIAAA